MCAHGFSAWTIHTFISGNLLDNFQNATNSVILDEAKKKNGRKSHQNQYDVRDSKCNMIFTKTYTKT